MIGSDSCRLNEVGVRELKLAEVEEQYEDEVEVGAELA